MFSMRKHLDTAAQLLVDGSIHLVDCLFDGSIHLVECLLMARFAWSIAFFQLAALLLFILVAQLLLFWQLCCSLQALYNVISIVGGRFPLLSTSVGGRHTFSFSSSAAVCIAKFDPASPSCMKSSSSGNVVSLTAQELSQYAGHASNRCMNCKRAVV
jgi:hypothetical protein